MSGRPEIPSPLHLLDELDEARELLILSYTANLDFFERFALSQARALGAVVTLISDALMVSADPVTARRAGTAYLDARAVCPAGAFHPKLVLLAGEKSVRVAIGSGNLTIAGWHGNAEMWTVLRGDHDRAPETLGQLAGFLRRLATSPVTLTPGAAEALVRAADCLAAFPSTEPGPQLLDNLDRPIIDQLPEASAQELIVSSPFFDHDLAALERLLARFAPQSLTACVQSQTSVDGPALLGLLAGRGEARWIADERYHHGKLIEWANDGRRWALTGSPNLSRPALLSSTSAGGNCELALLSEVEGPLAPASSDLPSGGVSELLPESADPDRRPGAVLLGAIRVPGAVRLLLHNPARQPGRVQRYDAATDGWRTIATLEPRANNYEIDPSSAAPGQAVRIVFDDDSTTNQVFVTDLARVRRPQASAVGKVRATPQEVAAAGLGPALLADIDELRGHLLRVGALIPVSMADGHGDADAEEDHEDGAPHARPAPTQTLEDYLAACDPVLGRAMTEFALVLPALPGVGSAFDEELGELDTDFEEESPAADTSDPDDLAPDLTEVLRSLSDSERSRWRRWVERLVDRGDEYPMVVRTLALRSVLHGVADGIWPEERWPLVLAQAVAGLASPGDEPTDEELAAAGSLGAIALALMRTNAPRLSVRDERTIRYEDMTRDLAPFLRHLDPERVALLAPGMPGAVTSRGILDACQRAAEDALQPGNGAERALRLLADEHEIEARIDGDATIVLSAVLPPYPEPRLFLALGLAREDGPIAARGRLENGTAVLAIWKAPHLLVEKRNQRRWGGMFELPKTLSPFNYANPDTGRPPEVASWAGEQPRPQQAENLMRMAVPGIEEVRRA